MLVQAVAGPYREKRSGHYRDCCFVLFSLLFLFLFVRRAHGLDLPVLLTVLLLPAL
jgi:hypothetical protein